MNTVTGQVSASMAEAIAALGPGQTRADLVELVGTPEAVARVSAAVRAKRRAQNKRARAARRQHRRP